MQWFEPLIALGAVLIVVGQIISYFVKKKKGTLKCDCGHYRQDCIGDCKSCQDKAKGFLEECRRDLNNELKM
jgi:hypothetical protein